MDVNVHPTKKEVHFLNEEAIIEAIASEMAQVLAAKATSRTFEYQVGADQIVYMMTLLIRLTVAAHRWDD